ncbi:MAG: exodeoxyribonuclease VII large subunit [Candidatus Hydrogenedentota bacterium]
MTLEERKVYTVTQINHFLKVYIEREQFFNDFWVKAEVSSLKYHTSGHIYFNLKDRRSQIRAVIFKREASKLKFKLLDGMEVFARCRLDVYIEGGTYSLIIQEIQTTGEGELYKKFLEIKEKLRREGLFEPEHKKTIPGFAKTIGVITARTGAVIRDILRVIKRRAPWVKVYLFPALVQGEGAAEDIIRALRLARSFKNIDVIIIGRGGGSMEDLWCFNDETLAREIFETEIPVVSAVGHEIDWTIVDYVSDRRAATPTEAAEICTPDRNELIKNLNKIIDRGMKSMNNRINYYEEVMEDIKGCRYFVQPLLLIRDRDEALVKNINRLRYMIGNSLNLKNNRINNYIKVLNAYSPLKLLPTKKDNLFVLREKIVNNYRRFIDKKRESLEKSNQGIKLLNPVNVLNRGYAIVEDKNRKLIKSIHSVEKDDDILVRVSDGTILSKIQDKKGL